ncbi:MAG: HU family DNA-binding protein [Treponematales bacterium]
MAVMVRKMQRKDWAHPTEMLWYLTQVSAGRMELEELAQEIEQRSSLAYGDVLNVLHNLVEIIPQRLKDGQIVGLGRDFGSFRLSVHSKGKPTEQELTARDVSGTRVLFTPSAAFNRLLEGISFKLG